MKTWTNNPEWQDPETGITTERGVEYRKEAQTRLYRDGKAPHPNTLNLKENETMSKFAKKAEGSEATETKAEKKVNTNALTRSKSKDEKAPKKVKAPKEEKASNDDRKITLITKENPKREGSAAHARFELYKKAKTVAQFYEAGGTSADLRADAAKGHIQVA